MLWTQDSVFIDNNARLYQTHAVMDFLQRNAITTILWLAQSPDLNPFENLWDILGQQVHLRHPHQTKFSRIVSSITPGIVGNPNTSGPG